MGSSGTLFIVRLTPDVDWDIIAADVALTPGILLRGGVKGGSGEPLPGTEGEDALDGELAAESTAGSLIVRLEAETDRVWVWIRRLRRRDPRINVDVRLRSMWQSWNDDEKGRQALEEVLQSAKEQNGGIRLAPRGAPVEEKQR